MNGLKTIRTPADKHLWLRNLFILATSESNRQKIAKAVGRRDHIEIWKNGQSLLLYLFCSITNSKALLWSPWLPNPERPSGFTTICDQLDNHYIFYEINGCLLKRWALEWPTHLGQPHNLTCPIWLDNGQIIITLRGKGLGNRL